jgi:acyl dehydratase
MTVIRPFVVPEVRLEDIVAVMEVMEDNNPIHVDAELVRELGLRGPVNQGPANLAYVINMLIAWAGSPEAIRRLNVRFHAISCPGDRLEARGKVADVTQTIDGPIAHCEVELVRDGGELILEGIADVAVTTSTLEATRSGRAG